MSDSRVDEYAAGLERWRDEFAALRTILADTELAEAFKWRKPCYTHDGKNMVIFQPFNDVCALMFFKGASLNDLEPAAGTRRNQPLIAQARVPLGCRRDEHEERTSRSCHDAVYVQQAGLRVKKPALPTHRDYPDELSALIKADLALCDAFERLTPGRQRGYLLHFSGAKQSATRTARIERVQDRIMEGFGLHD